MPIRTIHPFPARMAPDLALSSLGNLKKGSLVLDPMVGSGTVIRQAIEMGHRGVGVDMDPLAVLMSRVWTSCVSQKAIEEEFRSICDSALSVDLRSARLPWLEKSPKTKEFIEFWFDAPQRRELTRLAYALHKRSSSQLSEPRRAAVDVLRLALSKIIVTKEQGASLARDTSHSRPHKVADSSEYDVFKGFERATKQLISRLIETPSAGGASISLGDARKLDLRGGTVDAVMTSPPYLNAIDYLRGHRMSLVWLGHSVEELRNIRSTSIGSEQSHGELKNKSTIREIAESMCDLDGLSPTHRRMVERYVLDLMGMTNQIARVLKMGGTATFVVGNSCLKGIFIKNSEGLANAAKKAGMLAVSSSERALPNANRYLPITGDSLSKRMRTETVMTFEKLRRAA